MFNYFTITEEQHKRTLLSGNFGFSKTFSCVLFHQLINNIINYRLKYPKSFSILTESILNRPKVLYWSINLQKIGLKQFNDELNYIKRNSKELIKIVEQNKQTCPNWTGSEQQIIQYYRNNNIKILFIADQISQLTNVIKRKEQLQKQLSSNKTNNKNTQNQDSEIIKRKKLNTKQYSAVLDVYDKIRYINGAFQKTIFLSSIDISKEDWRKLNITGKQKHSQIIVRKQIYLEQTNKQIKKEINISNFL